jgi:hypothetical protein
LNAHGSTASVQPPARFVIDPSLPAAPPPSLPGSGPDGILIHAPLRGSDKPEFGQLAEESHVQPAEGPNGSANHAVTLDCKSQKLVYQIDEFPEKDYKA